MSRQSAPFFTSHCTSKPPISARINISYFSPACVVVSSKVCNSVSIIQPLFSTIIPSMTTAGQSTKGGSRWGHLFVCGFPPPARSIGPGGRAFFFLSFFLIQLFFVSFSSHNLLLYVPTYIYRVSPSRWKRRFFWPKSSSTMGSVDLDLGLFARRALIEIAELACPGVNRDRDSV